MSRPVYETAGDKSREREIADQLAAAWRCQAVKLPQFYPADYVMVTDSGPRVWVEIKRRNVTRRHYDTIHLSAKKVADLDALSGVSGMPAIFAVGFDDCLAFHKIAPPYPLAFGGRKDRGDWQDQEPVCEIKNDDFREI